MAFSIFPRTVFKTKSKISGEIMVKEQFGQYTLHVQNLIQSGGIIKGIWEKPLNRIKNLEFRIKNVLVLGLGGGTVVRLINKRWPGVKIVGIEINPEIIKIGRKFFGLGEIKNLKIVKADAFEWIYSHFNDTYHRSQTFDLIIVDVYLGDRFPQEAQSDKFLKNLKKLLSNEGQIIFNRLISPGEDSAGFEEKLKKHFSSFKTVETHTNLLFLVRN